MKTLGYCFLLLLFQACTQSNPKLDSQNSECNLPSPSSDTAQFAEFKRYMISREVPEPFIPVSDSMYCFRGAGGWADFDYLCSVYRDSTGYKAALSYLDYARGDNILKYEERIKPLDAFAWQQVQKAFKEQDFWCFDYTKEFVCADVNNYYLWAKAGNKFRLINWDDCEHKLDSLKILGKNLLDLCGMPPPIGMVAYSVKQDQISAKIFLSSLNESFIKSFEVYYDGKPIVIKSGFAELTLPRKDFQKLQKAIIVEHDINGCVRKFSVSRLQKEE